MRTVSNVGLPTKKEKLDYSMVYEATGGNYKDDSRRIVFYEPFAEKGARFTGYVEDEGSPFIKSLKFPEKK